MININVVKGKVEVRSEGNPLELLAEVTGALEKGIITQKIADQILDGIIKSMEQRQGGKKDAATSDNVH